MYGNNKRGGTQRKMSQQIELVTQEVNISKLKQGVTISVIMLSYLSLLFP